MQESRSGQGQGQEQELKSEGFLVQLGGLLRVCGERVYRGGGGMGRWLDR